MIEVDVRRRLGERTIAARFTAGPGLTVMLGRSGAGKTSLLNIIAGLLRPDAGHVRLAGEPLVDRALGVDVPPERRAIGYVFQDRRLFPHLKVRANLLYGERRARDRSPLIGVDEAIRLLGIGDLLGRWPRALSGGEAQRVAIGRALLSRPRLLLFDEPLSSLDPPRRDEIMMLIERIRDTLAVPILYVTHDRAEADRLATRQIVIDGQG